MAEKKTVPDKTREEQANELVIYYMKWSVGAGFIPVPVLDLATIAGIQLKLLSDLSKLYHIPFSKHRGKNIIGALVGGYVPTRLAWGPVASLIKGIPLVGPVLGVVTMPAFGGASTYGIGKVFIQHFESGGTFLDFDPEEVKTYFAEHVAEGEALIREKPAPGHKEKSAGAAA